MSDSSTYNSLKDSFAKVSEQKNKIQSAGRYLEDYIYKDLYVRFFKTRETNKLDFYAIWIFTMTDGWYYKKLDKFCLPILNEGTIAKSTETRAEFPGGEKEKMKFITFNMEYPLAASQKGIEGSVFVRFNVEIDGSLTDIEIVKGLEGGFNEEVIRLLKLMPKWKPATRDGKPFRSVYNMPMTFRIND
jgi:TonB family protein